ncbi:MAG TPA: hypothetical protein VHX66_05195 [Solirubrobacteraceae bacterium]|jgi:hypothetical protein|nr:hypothetical protein [Solirubrobacteraceae bacterium]
MRRAIPAVSVTVAVLAAASVAAATNAGNAKAIAFYTKSQAAMSRYEGIRFVGGGTSYEVLPSSTGADSFRFDFGSTPTGYTSAVAHVQLVQKNGVVVEEVDTLKAKGLPKLRIWQQKSIEIGEVVNGAKTCADVIQKNSASFSTIGRPYVGFAGYTFAKLTTPKPGLRLVRTSYPLAGGTARERDTISAKTHLWRSSHLLVTGGPYNDNFLDESHFAYQRTKALVGAPRLGRCG